MMALDSLTAAEIGLVRWYRSLPQRTRDAITYFLETGDVTLLSYEFSRHRHRQLEAA